mgnify:CR=1 FL=1
MLKVLQRLRRGDFLKIYWFDASESDNVDVGRLPLPNYNVETRQEEFGEFVCIQNGKQSGDPHLIYIIKRVNGKARIGSVRLCDIYRLEILGDKAAKKAAKPQRHLYTRIFPDGSVKYYGRGSPKD